MRGIAQRFATHLILVFSTLFLPAAHATTEVVAEMSTVTP